jgi:radical SAM protein with 4Fe4S-binding SPASM domain
MRPDVFEIARYGVARGLRVVMGTNGTLITPEVARKLAAVPVSRLAVSLDFPNEKDQDAFRGRAGAFAAAMNGIENAREAGIEIQINSTITRMNVGYLNDLLELSLRLRAASFHPFFLVPTGRGKDLSAEELGPEQYEKTLHWVYDKQQELGDKIFFKPTDVPHYMRVMRQRQAGGDGCGGGHGMDRLTRGCLAGTGFCFVSHVGIVQGCGYLDVPAGDLRRQSFAEVWTTSPVFNNLRNLANIKGKCGACEYKRVCGGCRARAYEATGDYLEAEPYCIYQPKSLQKTLAEKS